MARKRSKKGQPTPAPSTAPDRHSGVALPDPNVIDAEFTVTPERRPDIPGPPQLPGPPPIPSPLLLSGPTAAPPLIDPQALMPRPRQQLDIQDAEFTVRQPTPQLSAPAPPARPALPAPPPRVPITDPAFLLPAPVPPTPRVAQLQAPPASAPPPPPGAPPGAAGAVPPGQPDYSSVSHVRGIPDLLASLAKGAPEYQGKDQLLHQRLQEMVRLQQLLVDAQTRAKSADPQERAAGRDEAFRLDAAFGGTVRELSAQQKVLTGEYAARTAPLTGAPVDPRTAAAIAQATGQVAPAGAVPATTGPTFTGAPVPVATPTAATVPPPFRPPLNATPVPGPGAQPAGQPAPPATPWTAFTNALGMAGSAALSFHRSLDRAARGTVDVLGGFVDVLGGPVAGQLKSMFGGTLGGAAKGFALGGPVGALAGAAAGFPADAMNLGAAANPQAGATFQGTMELLATRTGTATGSDIVLNKMSASIQALSEQTKDSRTRDIIPEILPYISSSFSILTNAGKIAGAGDTPGLQAPPIIPGVGAGLGAAMGYESYASSFGLSSVNQSPIEMAKVAEQLANMNQDLSKRLDDLLTATRNNRVDPAFR
jgi:hypothetical protein